MQINSLSKFSRQEDFLKEFEKDCRSLKIPVITKDTGYFLEFAISTIKPSTILEIGCGNGFSTYFLIKSMKNTARYTGIDLNKRRLDFTRDLISRQFPDTNNEFIHGNALDLIPELHSKYDFVFIDAAKFEYPLYLERIKKKIKKNAMIIADNILYRNKIFLESPEIHYRKSIEGIKQYLKITGDNTQFNTSIFRIGDGLAVSIYKGGI